MVPKDCRLPWPAHLPGHGAGSPESPQPSLPPAPLCRPSGLPDGGQPPTGLTGASGGAALPALALGRHPEPPAGPRAPPSRTPRPPPPRGTDTEPRPQQTGPPGSAVATGLRLGVGERLHAPQELGGGVTRMSSSRAGSSHTQGQRAEVRLGRELGGRGAPCFRPWAGEPAAPLLLCAAHWVRTSASWKESWRQRRRLGLSTPISTSFHSKQSKVIKNEYATVVKSACHTCLPGMKLDPKPTGRLPRGLPEVRPERGASRGDVPG